MNCIETAIEGVTILEPRVFGDDRGFFFESYNQETFHALGIDMPWVQDNHSRSAAGVLRGLHFQIGESAQDKLVRIIAGAAFDVAVDIRKDSATFGQWVGVELSAKNKRMLLIPKGFAHGFLSLKEETEFLYKCSHIYDPQAERGIAWNDPDLAIDWPLPTGPPQLSLRDQTWPVLSDVSSDDLF
jgi:dTDP-4-dehydrorhamnose 3,5-epimerase